MRALFPSRGSSDRTGIALFPCAWSRGPLGSVSYDMTVWEGEPPADDTAAAATFQTLYEQYAVRDYPTPPTSKIAEFAGILVQR